MEHVVCKVPNSDPAIYNSLLELYLRSDFNGEESKELGDYKSAHPKQVKIMSLLTAKEVYITCVNFSHLIIELRLNIVKSMHWF